MIRLCGTRFAVKWIYLQVYVSLILLCCAAFFLVQLLYCHSQVELIKQFLLGRYVCSDICPSYPIAFNSVVCCTDYTF